MGVSSTHYIVYGVCQDDKQKVKDFFRATEKHYEYMDKFHDNGYQKEITPNDSGIHIIDDGMSGNYSVIGKILLKSLDGIPFTRVSALRKMDIKKRDLEALVAIIQDLDTKCGTEFGKLKPELVIFTHFH